MTGKNRKSYKKEAEYLQRKVNELKQEIIELKSNTKPAKPVINSSEGKINTPLVPKILTEKTEKVEPQAPIEQKNTLEIEEADEEEPAKEIKPAVENKEEEFDYECPSCNHQFNELNNGCCPSCDAELE